MWLTKVDDDGRAIASAVASAAASAVQGVKLRKIATGAAHIPHDLAERLREVARAAVIPTYGMSECMPIASAPADYALHKRDSVGRALCGQLACFTEEGRQVPVGEEGEVSTVVKILVRSYSLVFFFTFFTFL